MAVEAGAGDFRLGDDLRDRGAGVTQVRGVGELVRIDHAGTADPPTFLPGASVERIVAVNVLYALGQQRVTLFRQAQRILTPDGFVIASHTTRPGSSPIIRDQLHRAGLREVLRPRLLGIAVIDLIIDLIARGGRYDFATVEELASEAAAAGLPTTIALGRCYGGPRDGVNELVRISGLTV